MNLPQNPVARTTIVLGLFGFVAAGVLAGVHALTKAPIAATEAALKAKARVALLPADRYLDRVATNVAALVNTGKLATADTNEKIFPTKARVNPAFSQGFRKDGATAGFVVEVETPTGYGGALKLNVGIVVRSNDGYGVPVLSGFMVVSHRETPGLGTAALDQLRTNYAGKGRGLAAVDPASRVDARTGATISSLAVKDALAAALKFALGLLRHDFINLALPERELFMVPYAQKFTPVALSNAAASNVRELVEVQFFGRTTGYIAKVLVVENGTRYLGLVGFTDTDRKVYQAKLYTMPVEKGQAFEARPVDGGVFNQADRDKLAKDESKGVQTRGLVAGALEAYDILKRTGRWK